MSSKSDPLERAEECDLSISRAIDPRQKGTLSLLRDLWLALADQILHLTKDQRAKEIAALERIHAVTLELLSRTGIH
jgi:hypothetical protein